ARRRVPRCTTPPGAHHRRRAFPRGIRRGTAQRCRGAWDAKRQMSATGVKHVRVIDSHTEGEPTRVVVDGWPQPRGATMAERRDDLRARFDDLRRGVVCE